ncbi:MAG: ATP-binding protein [Parashewanella sp.]
MVGSTKLNHYLANIKLDLKSYIKLFALENKETSKSAKRSLKDAFTIMANKYELFFSQDSSHHLSILTQGKVSFEEKHQLSLFSQRNPKGEYLWHIQINSPSADNAVIASYTPKNNQKKQTVGVVVDLKTLISTLPNETARISSFLFSKQQKLIALSKNETPITLSSQRKISQFISQQDTDYQLFKAEGYLLLSSRLANQSWYYVNLMPTKQIRAATYATFSKKLFESTLILLFISVSIIICFHYWLVRPLSKITAIISNSSIPSLERYLPKFNHAELDKIVSSYNRLLDEMRFNHQELEQQISQRTQHLLAASRAAELANEQQTEHLTSISHEIRTPLNGVLGVLELLSATKMTTKQKNLISTAQECSHSLLALVNNLLDFSRIEAGQIQIKPFNASPIKVIDEAFSSISSQALNKGLSLSFLIDKSVPEMVEIDPQRIKQILTNLLGNAVKFTDNGSIHLTLQTNGDDLIYQVHDTGSGLTEQEQITIFDPYVQTEHQKVGTGLGLPISKKLTEMMKGKLTVSSKKNHGSCFSFSIPINNASAPINFDGETISAPKHLHKQLQNWGVTPSGTEENIMSAPELKYMPGKLLQLCTELQQNIPHFSHSIMPALLPWQLKILIVDDVDVNRDILSKMLQELGQTVFTAANANLAFQLGEKHIFDLILMDIRMPDINGYEATLLWRSSQQILDTNCPIFALTANADPFSKDDSVANGMDDYITKPVSLRSLNRALELAADIQIGRNISLAVNIDADTPLIDILHTDLTQKLYSQLTEMLLTLKHTIEQFDWKNTENILHTIKGTSGLAGLDSIVEEVALLEKKLSQSKSLIISDLKRLNTYIQDIEQ